MELAEFVSKLPWPASAAFGAVFAFVIVIARFGILAGGKGAPSPVAPAATVAAVIVDPTALNAATAALAQHTEVTKRLVDELSDLTREIVIHRETSRK